APSSVPALVQPGFCPQADWQTEREDGHCQVIVGNQQHPEAAAAALAPLGPEDAGTLRLWPERFAARRSAALVVPRPGQPRGLPPLLAAAAAASAWLTAEALEDNLPTPAQALLLAAAVARRRGRVR